MINAQLNLIIPIFIPENNAYKILSAQDYGIVYPSIDIESTTDTDGSVDLDMMISMLLKRYLQNSDSVVPKLMDIQVIHNTLMIYYLCFINFETNIINGVLKNIDVNNHIFPTNASKIISLLVR